MLSYIMKYELISHGFKNQHLNLMHVHVHTYRSVVIDVG